jgi:hypothetical protein
MEAVTLATGAFTKTWAVTPGTRYALRWYNNGSPTAGTITAKETDNGNDFAIMSGTDSTGAAAEWNVATMVAGSAPLSGGCEFTASAASVKLVGASLTDDGTYYVALVPIRCC